MFFSKKEGKKGDKKIIRSYMKGKISKEELLAKTAEDYIQGLCVFSHHMDMVNRQIAEFSKTKENTDTLPDSIRSMITDMRKDRMDMVKRSEIILTSSITRGLVSVDCLELYKDAGLEDFSVSQMLQAYKEIYPGWEDPDHAAVYYEMIKTAAEHIKRGEPYYQADRLLDGNNNPYFEDLIREKYDMENVI